MKQDGIFRTLHGDSGPLTDPFLTLPAAPLIAASKGVTGTLIARNTNPVLQGTALETLPGETNAPRLDLAVGPNILVSSVGGDVDDGSVVAKVSIVTDHFLQCSRKVKALHDQVFSKVRYEIAGVVNHEARRIERDGMRKFKPNGIK